VRDPAVSIRENFFTEQVEILRGPASSFAGRGVTGGAINIVTKQARDRDFYNMDASWATDNTKRVTIDINKVINPLLSVRVGGLFQDGEVAGRKYITDDRWGAFAAVKWTPTDWRPSRRTTSTSNSKGSRLRRPYYRPSVTNALGGPFTEFGVPRDTFYGFVNRDFQRVKQDIGTLNLEFDITDNIKLSNKTARSVRCSTISARCRRGRISPTESRALDGQRQSAKPLPGHQCLRQPDRRDLQELFRQRIQEHRRDRRRDFARRVSRNNYVGLTSEQLPGGFTGTGALPGVNIFNPANNLITGFPNPTLTGNPTRTKVDTRPATSSTR